MVAGAYAPPMINPSNAAAVRASKVWLGIVRPVLEAKGLRQRRMLRAVHAIRRVALDVRSKARSIPEPATAQ